MELIDKMNAVLDQVYVPEIEWYSNEEVNRDSYLSEIRISIKKAE